MVKEKALSVVLIDRKEVDKTMKKILVYSFLAIGLFGLLGVGIASAGWFGHFSDASPEEIAQHQEIMFQKKADFMGISVDEMKNAWAEGKNFKEIAEEQGITQEQIQERMRETKEEYLQNRFQAMVDNGIISQGQADQRLQFMEERMADGQMGKGFHKGFGKCWSD